MLKVMIVLTPDLFCNRGRESLEELSEFLKESCCILRRSDFTLINTGAENVQHMRRSRHTTEERGLNFAFMKSR